MGMRLKRSIKLDMLDYIKANNGKLTVDDVALEFYTIVDKHTRHAVNSTIHTLRKDGVQIINQGRAKGGCNRAGFLYVEKDKFPRRKLDNAALREMVEVARDNRDNCKELWELARYRLGQQSNEYRRIYAAYENAGKIIADLLVMAKAAGWDHSRLVLIFGDDYEQN